MVQYSISLTDRSKKQFGKLSKDIQIQIVDYLENRVMSNPLKFGKSLVGDKKGLWRYRIGDYRLICNISNSQLLVLVLDIGHRKAVFYR
jgi:mRNA interferase RelE/StbE